MRRILALFLALIMVFALSACQKDVTTTDTVQPGQPKDPPPSLPTLSTDPEPSQGLDAYDNPSDHPHEGMDLTVFDGTYRAKVAHMEDEETWVEVTGLSDCILLEHFGTMGGSVYRFHTEEFWPVDGWYTSTDPNMISGKSQCFSSMAQYENYNGMPQNRTIALTEDGIVLSYDDADAEYYERDDSFRGHTDPQELRQRLGEDVHLDFDYQYDSKNVLGSWGFWIGREASQITFEEDGSFTLMYKTAGEPIEYYTGVYGFGTYSGNLVIIAERFGYGTFPYFADWEWSIDQYGDISITDTENNLLGGEYWYWPVENTFFTAMGVNTAMGYLTDAYYDENTYTDKYGTEYSYYFRLPKFYHSDYQELEQINQQIYDFYYSIIEAEEQAMTAQEFLSYTFIDWQAAAYNNVLFLHVYAYTYDWEEHDVFYIDLLTMKPLTPAEMLERIGMEETYFLDTVRSRAESVFVEYFSEIPEAERESNGYYQCLEETVSDDFVNLDLPIYVTENGQITVYLKISSMAGSGIMWMPECPFEIAPEAVG